MVSTDKVKVAVRVRPLNRREIELGARYVVDMDNTQTFLYNPNFGVKDGNDSHVNPKNIPKTFAFDHCFWSISEDNSKYASQAQVFDCLGKDVLKRAFEGYNACIFAYGQTGSGKSYSMMGTSDQKGIIPRLCDTLFEQIVQNTDNETNFKVEVSYLEIYNEKVRDLLDPKGRVNLKVREHNILGSYVDGLSTLAVSSFQDIDTLMCEGNKSRTVAATNMNSESSRSHAVFNIILTQTLTNLQADVSGEKVSKISLVDLAGSERAQKTGAMGDRLKEGSNINKSLTTLGLVISALADQASGKSKTKFVPYRDSVLTWLLKDNLGGNSKTVMIATLSPSADNYEETLSTLRYADRAKRIVNHAVVNEDPNARIIRELREEVDMLRRMLTEAKQSVKPVELQERLEESEKLMKEIGKTWEEKLNETERIHFERHAALEKMGISVETSGIKVEQGKHYLVNLNADPCLNELLVYYLKEHTLIGRPDADHTQDIQLYGLGIMPEHCIMTIEGLDVYIQPVEGARTCVNGHTITQRMRAKHGDRIVWGNYHFFRLNCPKTSPSAETPENIDYDFAQQELMLQQMVGDPIQEAINSIEKQHEEDKQVALEKQRQMYERQMQKLRNQLMSPSAPSLPYSFDSFSKLTPTGGPSAYSSSTYATIPSKYQFWAKDREKIFRQSLCKLKEEVVKANTLVIEANFLAQELQKEVEYSVTLQIPATNLSPNRKRGAFVSEPAILVKYKNSNRPSQVWSMEKFENRVIDMRDCYEDYKEIGCLEGIVGEDEFVLEIPPGRDDPFFDAHENHHLIGVANVFLEVLFYDAKLDYHVPIISQQGEVAGRLHVEISRLPGRFVEDTSSSLSSSYLSDDGSDVMNESNHVGSFIEGGDGDDGMGFSIGSYAVCRVVVKEARGLPPALSNLVFCQYNFWGCPDPVYIEPILHPNRQHINYQGCHSNCCGCGAAGGGSGGGGGGGGDYCGGGSGSGGGDYCGGGGGCRKQPIKICLENMAVNFNHTREFFFQVTEEFLEHCADGALSIEVWGHRGTELRGVLGWGIEQVRAKSRSMLDRWNELTRKIELWVEIHELNDQGEYVPVEVIQPNRMEIPTGGAYQLRQGYSRRILVSIRPVQNSGTLPIICESIDQLSIGCVCARSKLQKGLDSYQEEDLNLLRQKWSEALEKRREYLDEQLQKIMNKKAEDKTDADIERERSLIDQWVCLAEERNAVLVPAIGSCIPGAPADWDHPPTMEQHIPVVFLDLNAEDMSTPSAKEGLQAVGCNSILPKEQGTKFFPLSFVKTYDKEVSVLASWDSSVHDSIHLNRITPTNERVYMILKVVVQLSHPARMEVVLRKRICINVYKKQSLTDKIKKKIGKADMMSATGVTYEIVSNIPKASEELEDRESLAQIAASQNNQDTSDGETYIEKYIKGVSAVESILMLDRLRQDVAVKEILAMKGRPLRKATSVPNIYNILTSPSALQDQIRCDSSQDISQTTTSATLINASCCGGGRGDGGRDMGFYYHTPHADVVQFKKDCGIGSPYSISPAQSNKHIKPLSTLIEEKPCKKSNNNNDDDNDDGNDIEECYEEEDGEDNRNNNNNNDNNTFINSHNNVNVSATDNHNKNDNNNPAKMTQSTTSIDNNHNNNNDLTTSTTLPTTTTTTSTLSAMTSAMTSTMKTSSLASSGYGGSNQAISTVTLSSEDSLSVQSVEDVNVNALEHVDSNNCNNNINNISNNYNNNSDNYNADYSNVSNNNNSNNNNDNADQDSDISIKNNDNNNISDVINNVNNNNYSNLSTSVNNNRNDDVDDDVGGGGGGGNDHSMSSIQRLDDDVSIKNEDNLIQCNKAENNGVVVNNNNNNNNNINSNNINNDINTSKDIDNSDTDVKIDSTKNLDSNPPKNNQNETNNNASQNKGQDHHHHHHQHELADDSVSVCSFGSRADLSRLNEVPPPSWIQIDEPVFLSVSGGPPKSGLVKYVGRTEFAAGLWVGVELDTPDGKNDGYVKGVRYFRCKNHHGVFVRHEKLSHDKKRAHNRSGANRSVAAISNVHNGAKLASSNLRRSMNNLTSPLATHSRDGRGSPNVNNNNNNNQNNNNNNNNNNNKSHNNSLNGSAVILNTSITSPSSASSSSSSFMKATVSSSARHK